jgi:hypothetical protein
VVFEPGSSVPEAEAMSATPHKVPILTKLNEMTKPCKTLPNLAKPCQTLPNLAKPCQSLPNLTKALPNVKIHIRHAVIHTCKGFEPAPQKLFRAAQRKKKMHEAALSFFVLVHCRINRKSFVYEINVY